MSIEENKALVLRLVEEVWNQGNLAVFDELYAPDFIFHDPGLPRVRTREEEKQCCRMLGKRGHVGFSATTWPYLYAMTEGAKLWA